jgi:hypothetical protein
MFFANNHPAATSSSINNICKAICISNVCTAKVIFLV